MSFEGLSWLSISCPISLIIDQKEWRFRPDDGFDMKSDLPLYRILGLLVDKVVRRGDHISIEFGSQTINLFPDPQDSDSLAFSCKAD
jgi:hypothetical protein